MSLITTVSVTKHPRRSLVSAADPDYATGAFPSGGTAPLVPPSCDGQWLLMRVGDVLDFGIDWSQWLDANDGKLASSVWIAHAASPKVPVFGASGIDQSLSQTAVIVDASAAAFADTYFLANTVTIADPTTTNPAAWNFPLRQLTRVIWLRVTA